MLKIAHRGASGHEAENSMAAFHKAVLFKVDYIELDVQLSKDNIPIVCHDRFLDRTTNLTGLISDFSLAELKAKARLKNGERLPTLQEVCEFAKKHQTAIYIDLKNFDAFEIVLDTVLKHLSVHDFLFGAFHSGVIKGVKEINPRVQTVLILEGNILNIQKEIQDSGCDIVALGFDAIDLQTVMQIKSLQKKVFTWTVNTEREIDIARKMGVDGITTNYPEKL